MRLITWCCMICQLDKPKAYNMCFQTPCHKMTSQPQFGHPAGFKTKGCTYECYEQNMGSVDICAFQLLQPTALSHTDIYPCPQKPAWAPSLMEEKPNRSCGQLPSPMCETKSAPQRWRAGGTNGLSDENEEKKHWENLGKLLLFRHAHHSTKLQSTVPADFPSFLVFISPRHFPNDSMSGRSENDPMTPK